jgi:hypothetical protein
MNLEQRINESRKDLDRVERVDVSRMWAALETNLEQDKKTKPNGWQINIGNNWKWSIAAMIVLAAGLFWLQPNTTQNNIPDLAEYYPHLKETEESYQQLISQKEKDINLKRLDQKDYPDLFEELELLEKIHLEYLKDVPEFKSNDQLINTLIRYYEQRIRILERLSNEIEKTKKYENRAKEIAI